MRSSKVLVASCVVAAAIAVSLPAQASILQPAVVSDNPVNYTPNIIDGSGIDHTAVYAVAQLGSTMYVGGTFALVQPTGAATVSRTNLVAFSSTTGTLTNFAPSIDGPVWAIATDGTSLYLGGQFKTVNGISRRALVKLDPTPADPTVFTVDTAFNANFKSGKVSEIRLVNGRLIVGGSVPGHLVALNPNTGANTGYINLDITGTVASNAGLTDVYRFAVNPAQTRLVAIGNFTAVNGQVRARAFMADLGTGSASLDPWYYQRLTRACRATKIPQQLRDVDFSPDGSYFVFVASGYIPQAGGEGLDVCDAAARFETGVAAPSVPTWINYTGGDSLYSVAATGTAVYVQGHQRWMDNPQGNNSPGPGAVDRPGIAALNSTTGLSLSWNPGKTRGDGGRELLATPAGLWVGSDGARFAGERRDNIAFCPLP